MPILVMKDSKSKFVTVDMVIRKGTEVEYAIEGGSKMAGDYGYGEVILKSDQETSIMAIKKEIGMRIKTDVKTEE